jgi:transcriptional regulator with XRE-family HTH domain
MKIGNNLRKRRMQLNKTQQEVADALGFKTHTSYAHWETGRSSPSIGDLERIEQVLQISAQELLFGKSDASASNREMIMRLEHLERENELLRAVLVDKGVKLGKLDGVTYAYNLPADGSNMLFDNLFGVVAGSRLGSHPRR